jgi:hypothetical protein
MPTASILRAPAPSFAQLEGMSAKNAVAPAQLDIVQLALSIMRPTNSAGRLNTTARLRWDHHDHLY